MLSSEPPTEEKGYSGAGWEFPFQPVCAHCVVPRELQIWDFAGSLLVAGFLAGWNTAALHQVCCPAWCHGADSHKTWVLASSKPSYF